MSLQHYRQLIAWQKAMELVRQVYRAAEYFPREEIFGLRSQIQRAAVSVPSNIAEGQGRESTKEFLRHLSIAYGSLMEVKTQILIALDLKYLDDSTAGSLLELSAETGRIINGLIRSLKSKLD
jgi:four helix bundle protein